MTARARRDSGDRRIYPDADACGLGASIRAVQPLASRAGVADLQTGGPAPSWLVRVGTCLTLHFPGGNRRLCLDRPGLLSWELGRRLFAILPGLAVKQTHSAAKKTHSVILVGQQPFAPNGGCRTRPPAC